MIRAENQAKQIALDAIRTMTIHPPHEATGVPGMKIERTGTKVSTIIEKTPYYNLHIGILYSYFIIFFYSYFIILFYSYFIILLFYYTL